MKSLEPGFPKNEHTNFKVEHLPNFDVILNLDYPDKDELDQVLNFLKEPEDPNTPVSDLYDKFVVFQNLMDGEGKLLFFPKLKTIRHSNVDFILGRHHYDVLNPEIAKTIDRKGRYAFVGVLNEIVLATKIKKLISTKEFRDLAQKSGFSTLSFSEPIVAVLDKKSGRRFLVYKNLHRVGTFVSTPSVINMRIFVNKLRVLFQEHGIQPNDLNPSQFMVFDKGDGGMCIFLIDTEAYTEEEFKESPKS